MKPVIKTTALAILVSLGVVGCKSNDTPATESTPAPVNNQANTNQNQVEKAKAKAKEAAEKAKAEAEKAKLAAEKAKAEADAKAKELAEKAKVAAEKAKLAAEKAKTEADAKAKEAAEKAKAEAEKAKLAAEKAKAEADAKAKEAAEKAKAEAEKAKLEAEKAKAEAEKKAAELKAKQEAEAKAKADAKAKEAAEKAKLEAEKKANEWRSVDANITSPAARTTTGLSSGYTQIMKSGHYDYELGSSYVDGYDGSKETAPVHNRSNSGYKLDYYQLAIEDNANPQLLGWHKGEIKSAGINGSEISKVDAKNLIVERTYPEKVDYMFKNTPYATYGAVYNNYDSILFVNYEKASSISDNNYTYQVGEYEVIDGNKTTKIKYNDAVKGAATYKGEVLAHIARRSSENFKDKVLVANAQAPEVDGTITINANFGARAEENFASAVLDSKALGKVEFAKSRMDLWDSGIRLNSSSSSTVNGEKVSLDSTVVGKEANEIVGEISHYNPNSSPKIGDVTRYEAVFAAEKQPK